MDSPRKGRLYPPLEPYGKGRLDVGNGHRLYYEMSGNPQGLPVVYLHGGPGAGCVPQQRRYFDPNRYLIVMFDQRGCGRSTPYGSVEHNTTWHLVADMERLREHLGLDAWLVAGGSWGATLALAYGVSHPERCLGFLLRGVFLGTDAEIDWFMHSMGKVFPEAHGDFADHVGLPPSDPGLLDAYVERLIDPSPKNHLPAARAWARYESRCSTLHPSDVTAGGKAFDAYALSLARLEAHYFQNHCFLQPDELLSRISVIADKPAIIVQGRYDIVCPFQNAHTLHLAWPASELRVVNDAGHSGMEPGIAQALAQGADALAKRLG